MRSKLVYSCSIKICASEFSELLENIFCLLLVVEVFSLAKSCLDAWRSGSWLARGQVNMVDEAEVHGPVRSALEALAVSHVVGHCWGESGCSVGQCWLQFSVQPFSLLSITSHMQWFHPDSGSYSESNEQQNTKQWPRPFLGACLTLGSALELLLLSSHWAGHCRLSYKIHVSSHITIQSRNGSLLLYRIKEDYTSKWHFFFLFLVSSWGIHLSSFFTFPVCFTCWVTIGWSALGPSAASHAVVRAPPLTMALQRSLSPSNGQPLHSSSSRLLSPLQSFEPPLHCTFISSSRAKWVVDVLSCLHCFMTHFEHELKKSLEFAFGLTSFL